MAAFAALQGRRREAELELERVFTNHRGREYVVSPDQIKALGVGRMLLVEKNSHRAQTVDVLSADHYVPRSREAA